MSNDLLEEPAIMRELVPMPGVGQTIDERAVGAHLPALLDQVAHGLEVVITSDGMPKARLVALDWRPGRKPFPGTEEYLKRMAPWRGGMTSEEMIREDRDARG